MGGWSVRRTHIAAQRFQRPRDILRGGAEVGDLRALGGQDRGLVRIGEKTDGCACAQQNDALERGQRL